MFQQRTTRRQQLSRHLSLNQAWGFMPEKTTASQAHKTRAVCFQSGAHLKDLFEPQSVSEILSTTNATQDPAVIVIEDIDPDWELQLSESLHIDAAFFREHARNPMGEDLWRAACSSSAGGQRSVVEQEKIVETHHLWHLDGVFEWKPAEPIQGEVMPEVKDSDVTRRRREPIPHSKYRWQQWNTCISHCKVADENICSYRKSAHSGATFALAIF